jgi:nitroreductase/predicted RNA-binding protein
MCETTVYLESDGQQQKLVEDVLRLEPVPGGVRLYKLFEPPRTVAGTLGVIDFHKHTATLIAAAPAIQLSRPAPSPRAAVPAPGAPAWILQRRSIREYTDAPVSEEQVQALLEAAMAAPSGHDSRPWAFVVVRDPARRQALADIHRWGSMCAQASVVVAVLGNPTISEHWVADCSAATENLLLASAGLGLGSVWVGVYPDEDREAAVRAVLHAPGPWRVLCLLPVGHPAEDKPARTRYEAAKVHQETFTAASPSS